jgi:hypothetical protein
LRKFEIVEPSLNSIFIDVVGPPAEAKTEPEAPATSVQKSGLDPRLKRSLFSVMLVSVIALVLVIANTQKEDPDWSIPALLVGAAGIALFRYLKMKKKIDSEHSSTVGEQP